MKMQIVYSASKLVSLAAKFRAVNKHAICCNILCNFLQIFNYFRASHPAVWVCVERLHLAGTIEMELILAYVLWEPLESSVREVVRESDFVRIFANCRKVAVLHKVFAVHCIRFVWFFSQTISIFLGKINAKVREAGRISEIEFRTGNNSLLELRTWHSNIRFAT